VVHGGGEPTLHWSLLRDVESVTRTIAGELGIDWWGYIATSGVMSEDKAAWLGDHFGLVGLSCDGPADVQDRQRPTMGGSPTSEVVRRTAAILSGRNAGLSVRVTITPETVRRQAEIVRFVHGTLGANDIRLEPAYRAGGSRQRAFAVDDAALFVEAFQQAEAVAERLGCSLSVSGVRLDEIHGPYCNVLRDVLHLTPDGAATACFLCTDSRLPTDSAMAIGRVDPATGSFLLDDERVAQIRRRATQIPGRCESCLNIYHCARECPDVCPVVGEEDEPGRAGGFRCRVQKLLGEAWVRSLAARAGASGSRQGVSPPWF
jgi:sulfatase maturation enzyme AslB (radical SAM superfamily)